MIFDIQKFATEDGDGIRTLVFFKGCPLHCLWCSNPESQSFESELMYEKSKCILCLDCVKASLNGEITGKNNAIIIDHSKKIEVESYRNLCPARALNVVGKDMSVEEIIQEILKDKCFYDKNGGGVTLSGGEPFAQIEFLLALVSELRKNNISIFIESCLHVEWKHIELVLEFVDCILGDLKHTDSEKYRKFTGGDVNIPLENFKRLSSRNINTHVRIPVIPNFNDTPEEMNNILHFANSLKGVEKIDFIPYHSLGKGKYQCLSREWWERKL